MSGFSEPFELHLAAVVAALFAPASIASGFWWGTSEFRLISAPADQQPRQIGGALRPAEIWARAALQLEREGSPPPGLRLPQAKLSRKSNQVARGRIRRFESYMPSQPVRSSNASHVNVAQNGAEERGAAAPNAM